MIIQVSTDNHIQGGEALTRQVESVVQGALDHFGNRLTRVVVHLTDESGSAKSRGDDMRCVVEARPASHQPITVTHDAPTLELALDGAADKMEKALKRVFDRLDDAKGRTSMSGD